MGRQHKERHYQKEDESSKAGNHDRRGVGG